MFSADRSTLTIGTTILAAQLAAMIATGFANLFTSLFQASGLGLTATVVSTTQGVGMWLAYRNAIERGLAGGEPGRAGAALDLAS
ncbi:hypothetical protein [Winogradskya humida]|uniref:PUCC protein n=1 Tax=Winogradskya humida TaxID=113566 RepID=A0ABQ3ZY04_9ACTN|nr:hypothetical protein [Actinoplanes humidus]GIE23444.1 hypothetical protein Ahu01nite_065460 [Actinoplanes humidus]